MEYTSLGITGLQVSRIGLGTEHLNGQSQEVVVSVIHEAVERGITYFDLIFALPEYLENMAVAFRGRRDNVFPRIWAQRSETASISSRAVYGVARPTSWISCPGWRPTMWTSSFCIT